MLALFFFFFFGEKTCVCVCVCRCSSTGPQSVNAPLGFVQRVRPADEPCQTTPVYLSFFCWDACPGWETLDEALEEEEKKPSPSGLHLCMQKYTQEYKHNAHISSHWCSVKQTHTRRGAEFNSYSFIFISPPSSSSQFLILPKCPHFCSHIFWRTEPCERRPLLSERIQTSIKQHMACLPESDRWCRCTFQETSRSDTALLAKQWGQEGSRAARCNY